MSNTAGASTIDTLVRISELTETIAHLETEAEAVRMERAALMAAARKGNVSLQAIGNAAGINHTAVGKAIRTLGPGSERAKERAKVARNARRRDSYVARKAGTPDRQV